MIHCISTVSTEHSKHASHQTAVRAPCGVGSTSRRYDHKHALSMYRLVRTTPMWANSSPWIYFNTLLYSHVASEGLFSPSQTLLYYYHSINRSRKTPVVVAVITKCRAFFMYTASEKINIASNYSILRQRPQACDYTNTVACLRTSNSLCFSHLMSNNRC